MKFHDTIMMRYYGNASFKAIGARIGKSEGVVQKLVARGVDRLRLQVNRRRSAGGAYSTASTVAVPTGTFSVKPAVIGATGSLALAACILQQTSRNHRSWQNTFFTFMTTTQMKIAVGIGIAVAVPLAYQWNAGRRESGEREPSALPVRKNERSLIPGLNTPPPKPRGQSVVRTGSGLGEEPEKRTPKEWKARRFNNLVRDLADEEWKIRRGAAALIATEVPADIAVPALIDALDDEEWNVRKAVADALASYEAEAAPAVPALINALDDEEWQVRNPAAMALAMVGSEAAPAVPSLTQSLSDEQWHVATNAAAALAAIGPEAEPAVPDLIQALGHEEWQVRSSAAFALGAIGLKAREAVDTLNEHVNDNEPSVRGVALDALRKIQGEH